MTRTRNAKPGALTYLRSAPGALIAIALLAAASTSSGQQSGRAPWPRRVLVTNDNGIDDRATLARVADPSLDGLRGGLCQRRGDVRTLTERYSPSHAFRATCATRASRTGAAVLPSSGAELPTMSG